MKKLTRLQKKALLAQNYKTYNDGSVYFVGFNEDKWTHIIKKVKADFERKNEKIIYKIEEKMGVLF